MRHQQESSEKVIAAIKEFARSLDSSNSGPAGMTSLVNVTSYVSLSNLGDWERLIRREFSLAMISTSTRWRRPPPFLAWVELFNSDGYRREKALLTMTGPAPNSFFFALALRRLNDWVQPIRKAAQEKLPLIAKASDPEHVVDALCNTLTHWHSWGHVQDEDRQVILEITKIEAVSQALKSRLISATAGPMASILSQVARTPVLDSALSDIAKNAIQPSLRAKAYRGLFERKMVWLEGRRFEWIDIRYCHGRLTPIFAERSLSVTNPFLETLQQAAVDRSPMVRRIAGEMLIKELSTIGSASLKLANLLSADRSPSVAERGEFALKRLKQLSS